MRGEPKMLGAEAWANNHRAELPVNHSTSEKQNQQLQWSEPSNPRMCKKVQKKRRNKTPADRTSFIVGGQPEMYYYPCTSPTHAIKPKKCPKNWITPWQTPKVNRNQLKCFCNSGIKFAWQSISEPALQTEHMEGGDKKKSTATALERNKWKETNGAQEVNSVRKPKYEIDDMKLKLNKGQRWKQDNISTKTSKQILFWGIIHDNEEQLQLSKKKKKRKKNDNTNTTNHTYTLIETSAKKASSGVPPQSRLQHALKNSGSDVLPTKASSSTL